MDGTIAQLDKISELAKKYNALVMSDECHSTGFIGEKGRGVHELKNVMGKVDIITGTLGKALGGASGGFTSSKKEVIEILSYFFNFVFSGFSNSHTVYDQTETYFVNCIGNVVCDVH